MGSYSRLYAQLELNTFLKQKEALINLKDDANIRQMLEERFNHGIAFYRNYLEKFEEKEIDHEKAKSIIVTFEIV